MNKPFVFAVCGYKNTGKTTLSVKLISALKAKGYRVASIKHDGHDFEADTRGTDSYRHREAGADQTIVFSENKMMMVCRPLSVETMIAMCADHDFILLEGFKKVRIPNLKLFVHSANQAVWTLQPD